MATEEYSEVLCSVWYPSVCVQVIWSTFFQLTQHAVYYWGLSFIYYSDDWPNIQYIVHVLVSTRINQSGCLSVHVLPRSCFLHLGPHTKSWLNRSSKETCQQSVTQDLFNLVYVVIVSYLSTLIGSKWLKVYYWAVTPIDDHLIDLNVILLKHNQLREGIQVIIGEPSNVVWQSPIWQLVFNLPHTLEQGTKDQSLPSLQADNFHYNFYKYFLSYIYTCKTDSQVWVIVLSDTRYQQLSNCCNNLNGRLSGNIWRFSNEYCNTFTKLIVC
jgi:hypothetical protein